METERLIIRTFGPDDLPAIHRILSEAFPEGARTDEAGAVLERESWLHWSILGQAWLPRLHQPPYGDRAITLKSTGALIGASGYVPLLAPFGQIPELRGSDPPDGLFTPEVGLYWVIGADHRRRGYAVEAAGALVDHAFTQMHLKRILATTEYENAASQGVMRSLGMQIARNPLPEPAWLQIVGVLWNPG
jgi:ribosomal-protein-alanine N-acetyltransferase